MKKQRSFDSHRCSHLLWLAVAGLLLASLGGGTGGCRQTLREVDHPYYSGLSRWVETVDGAKELEHRYFYASDGSLERVEKWREGVRDGTWTWLQAFSAEGMAQEVEKDIVQRHLRGTIRDAERDIARYQETYDVSFLASALGKAARAETVAKEALAAERPPISHVYRTAKFEKYDRGTLLSRRTCELAAVGGRIVVKSFREESFWGDEAWADLEENCEYREVGGAPRLVTLERKRDGGTPALLLKFDEHGRRTELKEYSWGELHRTETYTYDSSADVSPLETIATTGCRSCGVPDLNSHSYYW